MPIDGTLLGLQRRDAPLGEIRIGTSVEVPGKTGRKPIRLETFRFTTSVELNAKAVADKYGGHVDPWAMRKGRWEVITDRAALEVWVPPSGAAVDTNMELWDGPKRLRQCDGRIERISGKPCWCPRPSDPDDPASVQRALDERGRLASMQHPQACKPRTRINVTIPDLPGLAGTWMLSTGSVNAAVETAGAGDAMTLAREGGVYLPAVLSIQWRVRSDTGAPYPVPLLTIGVSMRELAEGHLPAGPGGLIAQLRPHAVAGAEQAKAITTGGVVPGEVIDAEEPEEPADGVLIEDDAPAADNDGDEWLDEAVAAARVLTTKEQAGVLWRQSAGRFRAGLCTMEDAGRVQDMIRARLDDLASPAAPPATLSADDSWAVKVDSLHDDGDAAAALAELGALRAVMDPDRAALIRAAITGRFPRAAAA